MKKHIIYACLFFLILAGCTQKDDTIKIGVLLPLTGEGSFWGKNAQKGIELAYDEVTKGELNYSYKLIFEDSETKPTKAVSAFNKLINIDGIKYSIVDMISSNVLAIAPIAEKEKVIIISPGASSPKITTAGDYVFRNWASDALQGKKNAQIVSEILKWKRVAILKINNEYGQGLSEIFKATGKGKFKIVSEESYDQGETHFKTLLSKIKDKSPDGVYVLAYPQEIPTIFNQKEEIGLKTIFLGTETFENNDVIRLAKNAAQGSIYTFPRSPDTTKQVVKDFRKNYKKKYGGDYETPADAAYDALHMIINTIEKVGNKPENVKNELFKFQNYQAASCLYSIDGNGDSIKEFDLKTIIDSTFLIYNLSNNKK